MRVKPALLGLTLFGLAPSLGTAIKGPGYEATSLHTAMISRMHMNSQATPKLHNALFLGMHTNQ